MNIAFQLFQIQQIDTEIDHAQQRLKEIVDAIEQNSTISEAEKTLEAKKQELVLETSHFNEMNDEIEKKKIKQNQSRSSLYSGKVQNPKELEDLQHEINSLENAISTLEESMMEALVVLDKAEENYKRSKAELAKAQSEFATELSMLTAEQQNLDQKIDGFRNKRIPIYEQIEAAYRNQYETLRARKKGIAVTTLNDDCCGACGTNLTASQRQAARSSQTLFICPNCGRIIYGSA